MSFDSLAYLLFLPAVALVHAILPHRFRWVWLLLASMVFYASWNAPLTLLLLLVIGTTYGAGLLLDRVKTVSLRRAALAGALLVCLGLLLYFKYASFLMRTFGGLLRLFGTRCDWTLWDILLPIGISFYTFQALSYVFDVYHGKIAAERHPGYYALYISFFPQLVAGPIERADALLPQMKTERRVTQDDIQAGLLMLLSGYFRKIVLADFCGVIVDRIYALPDPDGGAALVATVLFGVQIYCDFAGYSEIARGSARLLGVRLMQNFDRPYLSPDIRAFWRRWHISLSKWLADYVYVPLGGSQKGLWRQLLATLLVFFLSGLWHGANETFVVWGLFHGVLLCAYLLLRRAGLRDPKTRAGKALGISITYALVTLGWVFFRAQTLPHAFDLLVRIFSPWNPSLARAQLAIGIPELIRLLLSLAACPLLLQLGAEQSQRQRDLTYVFLVLVIALAWWVRLDSGTVSAFIYFQF
ncbi:MAG: MBOAT family protein [Clostridia bacterium]|nr:MBOAT family protein [Clostridia bacterium]